MQLSRLQEGIIRSSVPLKRLPFQLLSYNQILEVLTVLEQDNCTKHKLYGTVNLQ